MASRVALISSYCPRFFTSFHFQLSTLWPNVNVHRQVAKRAGFTELDAELKKWARSAGASRHGIGGNQIPSIRWFALDFLDEKRGTLAQRNVLNVMFFSENSRNKGYQINLVGSATTGMLLKELPVMQSSESRELLKRQPRCANWCTGEKKKGSWM